MSEQRPPVPPFTKETALQKVQAAVDDAAKTITFTIRDGVKFTSGNPLRPEDVIYSWKRVLVLNKSPATTFVVINEVETEDWGVGGLPVLEYRAQLAGQKQGQ